MLSEGTEFRPGDGIWTLKTGKKSQGRGTEFECQKKVPGTEFELYSEKKILFIRPAMGLKNITNMSTLIQFCFSKTKNLVTT